MCARGRSCRGSRESPVRTLVHVAPLVQGFLGSCAAETADLSLYDLGEHGVMPKCLAGVDVRHVELDDWHGENGQRVADAIAVVRPRAGVDEHRGDLLLKAAVNPLTHFLFAVGLET